MMRRKRHPHNLDPDGLHRPSLTARSKSKKELQREARMAYYAIGCFVLIGVALLLTFRYHHHNISIDDGREVDEEGMPIQPAEAALGGIGTVGDANGNKARIQDVITAIESNENDGVSASKKLRQKSPQSKATAVTETGSADAAASAIPNKCEVKAKSLHPRYATVVVPSVVNPNGRTARLKAISETWGCQARAIYVVHDVAEYPDAQGNLLGDGTSIYPKLLVVPPEITAEEGVKRLYHVIKEVTESALDPDFAFFVNDHTFVIPEHACCYISERDPREHLYAGHAMRNKVDAFAFNSGAAGYFLSRATMQGLVDRWDQHDPLCSTEGASKWHQGNPGLLTAKCMSEALNAKAIDTRDEHGWHRFHAFGLIRTVTGHVDEWYQNKHKNLDEFLGPDEAHHHKLGTLYECCSAETISFHYVEHSETAALYKIMEDVKSNPDISDAQLGGLVKELWPKGFRNLGGYSHGLPTEKTEQWDGMLTIIRRISQPLEKNCAGC